MNRTRTKNVRKENLSGLVIPPRPEEDNAFAPDEKITARPGVLVQNRIRAFTGSIIVPEEITKAYCLTEKKLFLYGRTYGTKRFHVSSIRFQGHSPHQSGVILLERERGFIVSYRVKFNHSETLFPCRITRVNGEIVSNKTSLSKENFKSFLDGGIVEVSDSLNSIGSIRIGGHLYNLHARLAYRRAKFVFKGERLQEVLVEATEMKIHYSDDETERILFKPSEKLKALYTNSGDLLGFQSDTGQNYLNLIFRHDGDEHVIGKFSVAIRKSEKIPSEIVVSYIPRSSNNFLTIEDKKRVLYPRINFEFDYLTARLTGGAVTQVGFIRVDPESLKELESEFFKIEDLQALPPKTSPSSGPSLSRKTIQYLRARRILQDTRPSVVTRPEAYAAFGLNDYRLYLAHSEVSVKLPVSLDAPLKSDGMRNLHDKVALQPKTELDPAVRAALFALEENRSQGEQFSVHDVMDRVANAHGIPREMLLERIFNLIPESYENEFREMFSF